MIYWLVISYSQPLHIIDIYFLWFKILKYISTKEFANMILLNDITQFLARPIIEEIICKKCGFNSILWVWPLVFSLRCYFHFFLHKSSIFYSEPSPPSDYSSFTRVSLGSEAITLTAPNPRSPGRPKYGCTKNVWYRRELLSHLELLPANYSEGVLSPVKV